MTQKSWRRLLVDHDNDMEDLVDFSKVREKKSWRGAECPRTRRYGCDKEEGKRLHQARCKVLKRNNRTTHLLRATTSLEEQEIAASATELSVEIACELPLELEVLLKNRIGVATSA